MGLTYNQNNVTGRRNSGATEYPITIGDGVNSWGRFNATQKFVLHDLERKTISGTTTDVFDVDIDSNGKYHVIFQNGADISYMTNESGSWATSTMVSVVTATRLKLKISPNGYLNVIYTTGAGSIKYAYKPIGSGVWTSGNTNMAYVPASLSLEINSTSNIVIGFYVSAGTTYYTGEQNVAAGSSFNGFTVTSITTGGAGRQKVLIDSNDDVYLLTNNSAGATGIYLYDTTPTLIATIETTGVPITQINSDSAAFDSEDNLHVLWEDTTDFKMVYAFSAAPYASVSTTTLVDLASDVFSGHSLIVDKLDNVHLLYHSISGGGSALVYASNCNGTINSDIITLDASASPLGTVGYIAKIAVKGNKAIITYVDNTTNVSASGLYAMTGTFNVRQVINTALTNAISSASSSNKHIKILGGVYYSDANINISGAANDNLMITGTQGTPVINFARGQMILDTVTGVTLSAMKFVVSNVFMYSTAAQTVAPMILLTASTCTNSIVTDMIFESNVGIVGETNINQDIEWTIADGHIVDSNISTTNTSGLGGI